MAITNAQQFKQLVNPPMKGKKRPGYRGDAAYGDRTDKSAIGDGPASRDFGGPGRDDRMGMGGKNRPMGRNPMVSFTEDPVTTAQRAREIIAEGLIKTGLGTKLGLTELPFPSGRIAGGVLNIFQVPQGTIMDKMRASFKKKFTTTNS